MLIGVVLLPFAVQYTSIKPLGDRVLVKIKTVEEKTLGGILLPTAAQTKPQGGEVVAVGEGRTIGKNKVDISVQVSEADINVAIMRRYMFCTFVLFYYIWFCFFLCILSVKLYVIATLW